MDGIVDVGFNTAAMDSEVRNDPILLAGIDWSELGTKLHRDPLGRTTILHAPAYQQLLDQCHSLRWASKMLKELEAFKQPIEIENTDCGSHTIQRWQNLILGSPIL